MRPRRPCSGLALRKHRVRAEIANRVEPPDIVGASAGALRCFCRVVGVGLARAALVEALAAFPTTLPSLAPGGHLSVELLAIALAMAHDATVVASAAEAARRCISAAAALPIPKR